MTTSTTKDTTLEFAEFADGTPAAWSLYSQGRMQHGVIIGSSGTGKSELATHLATTARSNGYTDESGATDVLYVDPLSGANNPQLWASATKAYGPGDISELVQFLKELAAARGAEQGRVGIAGFHPTARRPGQLVVVEEPHVVLNDTTMNHFVQPRHSNQNHLDELLGYCGKVGIGFLLVTESADRGTFGSDVTRTAVVGGNVVLLGSRLASKVSDMALDAALGCKGLDRRDLLPGQGYLFRRGRRVTDSPFQRITQHEIVNFESPRTSADGGQVTG
jgi:hypothetical protein